MSLRTTTAALVMAALATAILFGCDDDEDGPATPTASTAATTAPLDPGLAAVVGAIEKGDAAAVKALVKVSPQACTTAPGAGGPPKCAAGEAAGTQVLVFQFVGCEPEWRREPALDASVAEFLTVAKQPYAIYTAPAASPLTGATAVAVFEGPDTRAGGSARRGAGAGVASGKVTGLWLACGAGDGAKALVPPGAAFIQAPK